MKDYTIKYFNNNNILIWKLNQKLEVELEN